MKIRKNMKKQERKNNYLICLKMQVKILNLQKILLVESFKNKLKVLVTKMHLKTKTIVKKLKLVIPENFYIKKTSLNLIKKEFKLKQLILIGFLLKTMGKNF